MGKQARRKQAQRCDPQWQAIKQVRQRWLGHVVEFDIQRGDGLRRGRVTSISDTGDVVVVSLSKDAHEVPGVVLSLGLVDKMLKLVEK